MLRCTSFPNSSERLPPKPPPITLSTTGGCEFEDGCGVLLTHGIWFDRDELTRIVQFIRSGGLERSRARKKAELEEEARRLRMLRQSSPYGPQPDGDDSRTIALAAAAHFLRGILRQK